MEAAFCVEALEEALARFGKPEIFNTDQGSQFTGAAFTGALSSRKIAISMDGKGAWRDNVFVARLWCQRHLESDPPFGCWSPWN
jgi:putative transposase